MAYDQHGDGGTPGPVAGLDWDNAILQATLPDLNPAHVLLGVPLYGRAWGSSFGGAAAYSNVLYNALSVPGARVDYDFSAQTPFIVSPNGSLITLLRRCGQPGAQGRAGAQVRPGGDRRLAARLRGPGVLVALPRLSAA